MQHIFTSLPNNLDFSKAEQSKIHNFENVFIRSAYALTSVIIFHDSAKDDPNDPRTSFQNGHFYIGVPQSDGNITVINDESVKEDEPMVLSNDMADFQ